MISSEQVHNGINLGFHMLILFTFLTIFFFTFIARKEKESVTKELNNAIDTNVTVILHNVDKLYNSLGEKIIWSNVNNAAKNIEKKYDGSDPEIKKHNDKIVRNAIIIIVVLFTVLIGAIVYFTYKKIDFKLGEILVDNFFIALFIGIIETLFFMNIALKYSPVTPSDMINQFVDRTEYHINREIN